MKNRLIVDIATFGPLGYLPASGTIATILSLPIVYLLSKFGPVIYLISTAVIFLISLFIVEEKPNSVLTKRTLDEIAKDKGGLNKK